MRKRILLPLLVSSMLFCFGCTTTYVNNPQGTAVQSRLERGKKAYVATPKNGSYGTKVYVDSGAQVAASLSQALAAYGAAQPVTGPAEESQESMLAAAKRAGAAYAFSTIITLWEPRAARWSNRPTQVTMSVTVFDVATSRRLFTRQVSVTGRTITLLSQHAHELADEALNRFVRSLY